MAPRRRSSTTPSYYACPVSRAPGIYTTWDDAKRVVDAYPGAIHKVRFDVEWGSRVSLTGLFRFGGGWITRGCTDDATVDVD